MIGHAGCCSCTDFGECTLWIFAELCESEGLLPSQAWQGGGRVGFYEKAVNEILKR